MKAQAQVNETEREEDFSRLLAEYSGIRLHDADSEVMEMLEFRTDGTIALMGIFDDGLRELYIFDLKSLANARRLADFLVNEVQPCL